jgi:hypothetical protein
MALKQAPQRATAALEGTGGWWGREPTWVSAWVQAAWVRGIKVVPTFLGDDHGSKQIDKWGRALPRSRGVRVHSYAKTRATCSTAKRRAGDPDARAPVDAALTGPHGACQGAAACGVGLG